MQKEHFGEFGLIGAIRRRFADLSAGECTGIGDDCALLPLDAGRSLLVTTDMLVEGVHFLREKTSPFNLGYKSLAVNLSDIAAMGGAPCASFLSFALPSDLPAGWIDAFLEGYHALSVRYGVPLLGGDTSASLRDLSISVTAIGEAVTKEIKRRNDAKNGDILFVTGKLGNSAQGLLDLQEGNSRSPFIPFHHRPEPAVEEGKWLGKQAGVRAMMDLSDGLASDLLHILEASGASAEVNIEKIPTKTSIELAVTGGEDYQLLGTAEAASFPEIKQAYEAHFGKPLFPIGRITAGKPAISWLQEGRAIHPDWKGFTHF